MHNTDVRDLQATVRNAIRKIPDALERQNAEEDLDGILSHYDSACEKLGELLIVKDGLQKAQELFNEAECIHCGSPLSEKPAMGQCADASHSLYAARIAEIQKIQVAN